MMIKVGLASVLATVLLVGPAAANSEDAEWVSRCVKDNSDAKVSVEIVSKYCVCMNEKMSDDETRSVTEWEKSHPKEMAECDKESGWNK